VVAQDLSVCHDYLVVANISGGAPWRVGLLLLVGCATAGGRRGTWSSGEMVLQCGGRPIVATARLWPSVRAQYGSHRSGPCGLNSGVAC
jgi:hypothetical protein